MRGKLEITLSGPPGSGKTHFAKKIATQLADDGRSVTLFDPQDSKAQFFGDRDGDPVVIQTALEG